MSPKQRGEHEREQWTGDSVSREQKELAHGREPNWLPLGKC